MNPKLQPCDYVQTLFDTASTDYPAPGMMSRLARQGRLFYGQRWECKVASDLADARRAHQRLNETVTLDSIQRKTT